MFKTTYLLNQPDSDWTATKRPESNSDILRDDTSFSFHVEPL